MSELAVTAIKVLYLALLWLFILSMVSVIRSDLFGRTVPTPPRWTTRSRSRWRTGSRAKKSRRGKRGRPHRLTIVQGPQTGQSADLGRRRGS